MDLQSLEKGLKSGVVPPLLYLYGPEAYLRQQAVELLLHHVVPPEARDFNLQQFEGAELTSQRLLEELQTLPVFAPRRLILVRRAERFPTAEAEKILPYLADPLPESILVFVADKLDRRSRFAKAWLKSGETIEFKQLYDNQIPALVRKMVRDSGRELSEEAFRLFCSRVGTNLQEIAGELDKLFAYAGPRGTVEAAAVEAVVCNLREETIFALGDALGKRQTGEAIRLTEALLGNGEAPVLIINLLARHFRQLWCTHQLMGARLPKAKLAGELKIRPFFVDNLISQARRFEAGQFPWIMRRLLQTDLALKSGGGVAEGLLLKLVLDLTGSSEGAGGQ